MNIQQLEDELWEAADQLRANSKLTATEYSMPVLGLIFLRQATNRFHAYLPEVEAKIPARVPAERREAMIKQGFKSKAAIYLPQEARFDYIASQPTDANIGEMIDQAMTLIEADHEVLAGALPRGYTAFESDLLAELIKIFNRAALQNATGDVFGRIYEYFLSKFAMSGAQEGGEFFTPPSLVRMIVNIIEPDHGLVLDPACGSAGMFVQTGHFIEDVRHADTNKAVTFHGQEKSDTNTRLARMNMAVHGLDATNLRQGNTFYDQIDEMVGACDFVMANPPFNVDGVDTRKIEKQAAPDGRLPFGLPGTNGKTGAISNANSLWIQYFYAYLNDTGRAGFVMASSASDAGNKDRDIREKLVKTGHVDVMMAIGNKFFYTVSLPCTLWFYDKGKPDDLQDQVLMIDARSVYHVVSARSHVFTDEQLANLTAIVWLYRGEQDKYRQLLHRYQQQARNWLGQLATRLQHDDDTISQLLDKLNTFATSSSVDDLLDPLPRNAAPTPEQQQARAARQAELTPALADFRQAIRSTLADTSTREATQALLDAASAVSSQTASTANPAGQVPAHAPLAEAQQQLESLLPLLKSASKALEARHKHSLALLDTAEKTLRARQSKHFESARVRALKEQLKPADDRQDAPTVRDQSLHTLKQASYFIQQGHWLHNRFPQGIFNDVPGLCKAVTREEIAANDYSLTPGRYVGVAASTDDDEEDFIEKMREIHDELAELNEQAGFLAKKISFNLKEVIG